MILLLSVIVSTVLNHNPAQADVMRLAKMMTAEARGEGDDGMIAVAWVAINRANNPSWWGDDLLTVLVKPYQFAKAKAASENVQRLAHDIITGQHPDPTDGATHFHADYMTPYWADRLTKTAHIGNHVFYR